MRLPPLLWLGLYRRRRLFLALAVGLAAFESLIVLVAAAIPADELFAAKPAPESLNAFSGSSGAVALASLAGLLGAGLLHPFWIALQLSAVASLGAAVIASDVEEGTIELIAVRPVSRLQIFLQRAATMLVVSAVLALIGVLPILGAALFVERIGDAVSFRGVALTAVAGYALILAFIGIALAVSCAARKKATVIAAVAGIAAISYAVNFIAEAWDAVSWAGYLSPFHYYRPADVLVTGSISSTDLVVLLSIFVVGAGAGLVALKRRDLTS